LAVLPSTPGISAYRLGPAEQLDIYLLGADGLKGRYSVRDDGTIGMPLIGKVRAADLTFDQIEKIVEKLAVGRYVTKPEATISVMTYRPFYILGEVARLGGYPTPAACACSVRSQPHRDTPYRARTRTMSSSPETARTTRASA
jgi:polysaccharide biosynthesis/export protein